MSNNRVPEWKDVALGQVPPSSTNIKEQVIYRNNDVIGFPFKEIYCDVDEIPVKEGDFATFIIGEKKYSGRLKYTEIEHNGMVDKWYYIGNLGMLAYSFDMEDGSPYYDIPLNDNVPYVVGFEQREDAGSESGYYFECVEVIDRYNPEEQYPTSESVTININGIEIGYADNFDNYYGSCGKFSLVGQSLSPNETYVFIFDGVRYTLSPDYQDVFPNIICDSDGTTFAMINKPMFHHTVKILTETAEQDNGYGWSECTGKVFKRTLKPILVNADGDYAGGIFDLDLTKTFSLRTLGDSNGEIVSGLHFEYDPIEEYYEDRYSLVGIPDEWQMCVQYYSNTGDYNISGHVYQSGVYLWEEVYEEYNIGSEIPICDGDFGREQPIAENFIIGEKYRIYCDWFHDEIPYYEFIFDGNYDNIGVPMLTSPSSHRSGAMWFDYAEDAYGNPLTTISSNGGGDWSTVPVKIVRVNQEKEIIHKINEKYIPTGGGGDTEVIVFTGYVDEGYLQLNDGKTAGDIGAAFENNIGRVFIKESGALYLVLANPATYSGRFAISPEYSLQSYAHADDHGFNIAGFV